MILLMRRKHIDSSLCKFKHKDLLPRKTTKFNEVVARIGEDTFTQLTGAKKRN